MRKTHRARAGISISNLISGACEIFPYNPHIEAEWQRFDKYHEPFNIGIRFGEYFLLPRVDTKYSSEGEALDIQLEGLTLKPEQQEVMDDWLPMLDKGVSGQLEAITGFGKTIIAIDAMRHVGRTTLIVAPKTDALQQFAAEIIKFTNILPSQVGFLQGKASVKTMQQHPVVMATVQTLARPYVTEMALRRFGFCIFDEVDAFNAEFFQRALFKIPARIRWGMSATCERTDGRGEIAGRHLGPVRVMTEHEQETPDIYPVHMPAYMEVPPFKGDMIKSMAVFNKIIRQCKPRNEWIAQSCYYLHGQERNIIVFAQTLKHLEALKIMTEAAGVPAQDTCLYIGGMKETTRLYYAATKKIFFATYAMASRSTNIPRLDTLVFATPQGNVRQSVGRIRRPCKNKKTPRVYDIRDPYTVSNILAKSRDKWYTEKEFPIIE